MRRPAAFLMDEPLSNLDAKLRGHMRAELKHMQHELGITTIYVTHDQIEAMTLAHRVALLDKGVLQQLDTPARHLNDPANLFVAGFIGSPPMNFLRGTLEGRSLRGAGCRARRRRESRRRSDARRAAGGMHAGRGSEGEMRGRIYSVELIGDHSLVTLNVGEQQVIVKVSNMFAGRDRQRGRVAREPRARLFLRRDSGQRIRQK